MTETVFGLLLGRFGKGVETGCSVDKGFRVTCPLWDAVYCRRGVSCLALASSCVNMCLQVNYLSCCSKVGDCCLWSEIQEHGIKLALKSIW